MAALIARSVSFRSNCSNGCKMKGIRSTRGSGENLTLAGLEWDLIRPGVVLSVGPDLQLEVKNYTAPCSKNARWFRDGDYQRISQKKNPGWSRVYAKVLRDGVVRPGDVVEIRS